MADALLSAAVERLIALIEEEIRLHFNLVRGAEKEVRSLAKELNTIRNVLEDAENRRFQDKNINSWLSRLEQTSYEMEDVLDEWDYAILKLQMGERQSDDAAVADAPKKKVCSFIPSSSCLCFKKAVVRHEIAQKIVNVKAKLDEILKEKDRYGFVISQPIPDPLPQSWRIQSISLVDLGEIHGRDRDGDILVSKLMGDGSSQEESGIQVLSIVGVGGLGKTTLAQLAYNHSQVEKSFDLRIWICVSDRFDLASIAKGILESVGKGSLTNSDSLDVLFKHVGESITGRRFFLVLDDVWTEDYRKWEPLKNSLRCGGAGSKILVTSRSERVVKMMGTRDSEIFRPGLLSNEVCWLLLCRMALPGRNTLEFEDVGKKIAKKCNGLPLAAKTLGSLLRFKGRLEEWENVLKSEIWNMVEAEVELFPHLFLSYNELSPTLKRCFSYCAVFPKDSIIDVESLIENWMALGYLGSNTCEIELKGQECFDVLAMRSLFQDFVKDDMGEILSCKMHDIVHDFAQFLRKSGWMEASGMNKITCQVCDPLLVSTVNEFCSLRCNYKETPPNLCGCLVRLRVISLTNCGLQSIPQGIEKFIHLRRLNLMGINTMGCEDLKIIFQLYNLQTLALIGCSLKELPREIENLIHLRRLDLSENWALKELPMEIGNLFNLRSLKLRGCCLKELPSEIGNMIHLRRLDLSENKSLKKLPREIGNLIQLRSLNLSWNESLEELPSEIGNLILLKYLDLARTHSLKELPESICRLRELQTLNVFFCNNLCRLPEGLAQLTSLCKLVEFKVGSGRNSLGLLKNLSQLCGLLSLNIRLGGDEDLEELFKGAREAELRNKIHIEDLRFIFGGCLDKKKDPSSSSRVWMDIIDALEPHPNLRQLEIEGYRGSKLPLGWMVSPLNQLRRIHLYFNHLASLPPLGKLPCLEDIIMDEMDALEIVGREFLGIGGGGSSINTDVIAFPKLKALRFWRCRKMKEWEDITAEEEECAAFHVMPCLTLLEFSYSDNLTALPHRLLRKATSLKTLDISRSEKLKQRYANKDGSDWKSITQNNPGLQLK
ncbi:hypothetical protein ACS0TY_035338 [Phlomoides rotata]